MPDPPYPSPWNDRDEDSPPGQPPHAEPLDSPTAHLHQLGLHSQDRVEEGFAAHIGEYVHQHQQLPAARREQFWQAACDDWWRSFSTP